MIVPLWKTLTHCFSFPFLSFPFLSFPFLSFSYLSFPFLTLLHVCCDIYDSHCMGPTVSAQLKAHLITLCTHKWRWGKNPEQLLLAPLATWHVVDTLDERSFTFSSFFPLLDHYLYLPPAAASPYVLYHAAVQLISCSGLQVEMT